MLNDSVHMLRRKIDEIKFEKAEMQKVLEQKGFQRNQVRMMEAGLEHGEARKVEVGLGRVEVGLCKV